MRGYWTIKTHPQFHPVLRILVLNDGSHLEVVLEGAGDVVGRLAGLDAALDAGAHPLLAEDADQGPAGGLKISSQTESADGVTD